MRRVFATSQEGERRYSSPDVVEAVPCVVVGNPDKDKICTSHVENFDHPNAHETHDSLNEWLLEEMGEPESGVCDALRLLQLLPCSFDAETHPGDGSGHHQSCLGD